MCGRRTGSTFQQGARRRQFQFVSPILEDDVRALKRHEEVLVDDGVRWTNGNRCWGCFRWGKVTLSRFYGDECRVYVCPDWPGMNRERMRFTNHKCMQSRK